jgi:hypothetical protein
MNLSIPISPLITERESCPYALAPYHDAPQTVVEWVYRHISCYSYLGLTEGMETTLHAFYTSALDTREWSASCSNNYTLRNNPSKAIG